jgi:glycine cleavage system H lipoate-binding protein
MRCPFLREAQVKYCRGSAFRKMIVCVPGQADADRCTSPDFVNCPAALPLTDSHAHDSHCPFLQESLVQYCAAASVTKYIPYSEAELSHCGTDSHKYCELFLTLAHPERASFSTVASTGTEAGDTSHEFLVEGIRVPGWLGFSPNHMWIDIDSDGLVHIGIDAFLASMLDSIDRITYVTTEGVHRPTVVLTIHGVDLQMVFPHPVRLKSPNLYVRAHPSTLLSDPYALGWLFEGTLAGDDPAAAAQTVNRELLSGKAAAEWIESEIRRVSQMAHALSNAPDLQGEVAMADGGTMERGFIQHLKRDDILRVFNEFFSPYAEWRDSD